MLVTVIIPTYNRANRVSDAIKSLISQSYPHVQIIVIDDGSTDNTQEVVAGFNNVEYFFQPNGRQASARNLGLKHAKGEFIATLDSDDTWNHDFLSQAVECLEKNELDFVFANWACNRDAQTVRSAWDVSKRWRRYNTNPDGIWNLLSAEQARHLFIRTCPAPSSSLVFRRSSIQHEWNTELRIADDWCFVLDLLLTKETRSAFTMTELWTKNVGSDNIYDGQNRGRIAQNLEVFDMKLMLERFSSRLSSYERTIFRSRILRGRLIRRASRMKLALAIRETYLWKSVRHRLPF
jgi:glycosyltransferase involved in cell wall biosynthesis